WLLLTSDTAKREAAPETEAKPRPRPRAKPNRTTVRAARRAWTPARFAARPVATNRDGSGLRPPAGPCPATACGARLLPGCACRDGSRPHSFVPQLLAQDACSAKHA